MPTHVSIADAQSHLRDLIVGLLPTEEIVITENARPIARLIAEPQEQRRSPPGFAAGFITTIIDDDEHLCDFEDFVP